MDVSGYRAVDEVDDGPFWVLSVVDNRRYRRRAFRVLDHDPTQADVPDFLANSPGPLQARQRAVLGITTDGAPLYPQPWQALGPGVRHQVCEFPVRKEIRKAVLHAVAQLPKELAAQLPKQPRGRPQRDQQAPGRRAARHKQRLTDLFEHRHLVGRHEPTPAQREVWRRRTRGLPQVRTLPAIVDEVYRLFDRRCTRATALGRLRKLRRRVRQLKRWGRTLDKLTSANLEKALVFLDDQLLPAPRKAVERGHRRLRKAQKSIYSGRTQPHLEPRIALDRQREQRANHQRQTLKILHRARSDS